MCKVTKFLPPMFLIETLPPDLVVRKADIELKSREEEIRFLKMEVLYCYLCTVR